MASYRGDACDDAGAVIALVLVDEVDTQATPETLEVPATAPIFQRDRAVVDVRAELPLCTNANDAVVQSDLVTTFAIASVVVERLTRRGRQVLALSMVAA
eukprot:CAMPEP_0203929954 /NCGR_PEP_ID=MMETSP0359-20131031/68784_1 /ASSEMBLY_ACC=CAM_ASM_000338 /TAXON_ID=268821 /ORGANISM="Scrippsiella Hangoei, Strain SHTV-5" /LENGTH=99 /DNA_ID=CAMNT_0050859067 /DNA_START=8 /DNA_END=304 /DNA_ORIENTATION=+